ncbi:hypothetical protein UlMin_042950 [Ulmus minor]
MTKISIIVMGCGGFGSQLLQHIVSFIVPDVWTTGLSDNFLLEVCRIKLDGSSLISELTKKIVDVASLLVVDFDCCVVLANKKPRTSKMEDYDNLVSQPRRIQPSLNGILSSSDPDCYIIWSLSGTLGYVMSEVKDGKPFSQVVKSTKSLGYQNQIHGMNSVGWMLPKRLLILSRLPGQRLKMDSIKIESLYPEAMGPNVMSFDKFLGNVSLLDKDIQERVHKASWNGNVLRYVCVIEVSRRSDNVLDIYSRCYSGQPLVIQGAGAGAGNDTTACGVLADIIDMRDLFP